MSPLLPAQGLKSPPLGGEVVLGRVEPRTARPYVVSVLHEVTGFSLRLRVPGYAPLFVGTYRTFDEALAAAQSRVDHWRAS